YWLVGRGAGVRRIVEDGTAGRRELRPRHLEEMTTLGIVKGPRGMDNNVELAVKLRAVFSPRLLQNPHRQPRVSVAEPQREVDVEQGQEPRPRLDPGEGTVEARRVGTTRVERAVVNQQVAAIDH